jgi:hypothetical protein
MEGAIMLNSQILQEFRARWLPHATDRGLNRVLELLRAASPLLIHGAFTRCSTQGCLATHLAWHHPTTERLQNEAGVIWLTKVAQINPATSHVILAWDRAGVHDWDLREDLLGECHRELERRAAPKTERETVETAMCAV